MIRKDQTIRHNDIVPSARRKNYNLSNILRRQRLTATVERRQYHFKTKHQTRERNSRVHSIRLSLITIEPHHRELSLDLPRINADNPHPCGDELFPQALGESSNGGFGRAVDPSSRVGFATCDRSDIDDIAGACASVALEHALQDFLGHVDEACDVGREHDVHVFFGDLRSSCDAFD